MSAHGSHSPKLIQMTQTPVRRLVVSLAVPTIISMLVTSCYNMADTYFVGKIGTSATAAVGVTLPLMSLFQAVGFTFGQGSGNIVARMLGQGEEDEAGVVLSVAFFSAFACGIAISILGTFFLEPLVNLLGATPTSAPYAIAYIRIILLGAPFIISSLVLNNQFRFQGNAVFGMVGIFSGAVVNVVLDPIFIFVLDMGTGGAALATVLSQILGFCLLVGGTFRKNSIRLSIRQFRPTLAWYRKIMLNGLPAFWRQALASLAVILLNVAGRSQGGDTVVAAMSIVSRVTLFANYAIMGFGQGYQPVCGFNYGAGLYSRVREAFLFFCKVALGIALVLSLLGFLFAPEIIGSFRRDDPEVIRLGALALRLQCITLPLMAWTTPTSMTLQTIGHSLKAMLLSMCQQGLTFVPLILTLPSLWNVFGIQVCQPLADGLTFLIALPMGIGVLRELSAPQMDSENGRT